MRIVITGPKGSGKSLIGKNISKITELLFNDTDKVIEDYYFTETGIKLGFREIYRRIGKEKFSEIEEKAIRSLEDTEDTIISTGGSSFLNPAIRMSLRKGNPIIIYLYADLETLWGRVIKDGIPAYLEPFEDPKLEYENRIKLNYEVITPFADIVINTAHMDPEQVTDTLMEKLIEYCAIKSGDPNTFGDIVRITTFGESHGKAYGVILDGIKPGIPINEDLIQKELDRRKPGQSQITTARGETDTIQILSGVFEGVTTGTPIGMVVYNRDQDSSKYDNLRDLFRPGHADFTFFKKYGIRDHRGGGRSSGRETISRVAGGAIAKTILQEMGIDIIAHTIQIGKIKAHSFDRNFIESNPVRTADHLQAKAMENAILEAKKQGDSTGGIVELKINGIKPGIGDPVFGKLNARLAHAIFTIGAIKGIEFGAGFKTAEMKGSEYNDEMTPDGFKSNNSGGISGGISNGNEITVKIAVHPTPSLYIEQESINTNNKAVKFAIDGRHDPCIVPRIIPVIESMAALVILDAIYMQERQNGRY